MHVGSIPEVDRSVGLLKLLEAHISHESLHG